MQPSVKYALMVPEKHLTMAEQNQINGLRINVSYLEVIIIWSIIVTIFCINRAAPESNVEWGDRTNFLQLGKGNDYNPDPKNTCMDILELDGDLRDRDDLTSFCYCCYE